MSLKDTLKQAKRIEKDLQKKQQDNQKEDILDISASRSAIKPRNYLALDPLLQKGGLHEKEDVKIIRKKRRRETKQALRKTDWLSEI